MTWWRLMVCSTAVVPVLAQPFPFDGGRVHDAVQDGTGRVWGIDRESGLFYWAGDRWEEEPVRLPALDEGSFRPTGRLPGARPRLLRTNQRGDAFLLWSRDGWCVDAEDQYWITRLRGDEEPVSRSFRAWLRDLVDITFDSHDTGWLTQQGPRIYRIDPDLKIELACSIGADPMSGTRFDLYNPIRATPDPAGRILFWGEQWAIELATLRGILVFFEGKWMHHPSYEVSRDGGFTVFDLLDSRRAWAGATRPREAAGFYELDLITGEATRLREPERGAFARVTEIFAGGEDRYVVAESCPYSASSRVLWRWRAGNWERIQVPLDKAENPPVGAGGRPVRPVLTTGEGLWIGTSGNGLLHLPGQSGGPAQVLDWRRGQPLDGVHRMAAFDDGTFLLIGLLQGATRLRPGDLLEGRPVSPRLIHIWEDVGNLQRDRRGHLWAVRQVQGAHRLSEWDGTTWTDRPLPPEIDGNPGVPLGIDYGNVALRLAAGEGSADMPDRSAQAVDAGSSPFDSVGFTSIELARDRILLRWTGEGSLQAASEPDGPWTEVPDATSPYVVAPAKPREFYRLAPRPR